MHKRRRWRGRGLRPPRPLLSSGALWLRSAALLAQPTAAAAEGLSTASVSVIIAGSIVLVAFAAALLFLSCIDRVRARNAPADDAASGQGGNHPHGSAVAAPVLTDVVLGDASSAFRA